MASTVTVGVRISPDQREALKRMAKKQRRTMSSMAAYLLDQGITHWWHMHPEPDKPKEEAG